MKEVSYAVGSSLFYLSFDGWALLCGGALVWWDGSCGCGINYSLVLRRFV